MAPEVLQQLYFSQGALRQDLLAEDVRNFLYRNTLPSHIVCGGTAARDGPSVHEHPVIYAVWGFLI